MRNPNRFVAVAAIVGATLVNPPSTAARQQSATVTAEDYARAESFLATSTNGLVHGSTVQPNWLPGDRFWYRNTVPGGAEFILVDPAAATRERVFDHARLAAALSAATGIDVEPLALPFRTFELSADRGTLTGSVGRSRLRCDLSGYRCVPAEPDPEAGPDAIVAPDGRVTRGLNPGRKSANYLQGRTICASCRCTGPCWNVPRERENRF